MTKTFALALALVLAVGTIAGCSAPAEGGNQAPKPVAVGVSCDDFQKPGQQHVARTVEVATNGTLTVSLCSNPSTGFSWEEAKISDQTVLQQLEHQPADSASATPAAVGAPDKEVWTFKALKPGQATVSMQYSRLWAGGEKGVWSITLTVVVR